MKQLLLEQCPLFAAIQSTNNRINLFIFIITWYRVTTYVAHIRFGNNKCSPKHYEPTFSKSKSDVSNNNSIQ